MTILDEIESAQLDKKILELKIELATVDLRYELDQVVTKIAEKRTQLEEHLKKNKIDKVHSTDGKWYFSRSFRTDRSIVDEPATRAWLIENDLLERYTRLDKVTLKTLAGKREIPGFEVKEIEIFTLKEVQEKQEQVKPTETVREMAERIEESK